MKDKLLLAFATMILGMTTFAANGAYADMTTGMQGQTQSRFCSSEGWNVLDPSCVTNITEPEGKAAYGEPREDRMEPAGARSLFCANEGLNLVDANCADDIR